MKIAFINDTPNQVKRVFPELVIKKLGENDGFDTAIYSKNDVLAEPEKFAEIEYIFSTWGMPAFSEEEIASIFPRLKCVFYAAGTVQGFARQFLNKNVKVFSAWAANGVPVAEYTVSQIILANKGFYRATRMLKSHDKYGSAYHVFSQHIGNYNAKIGIIGAGMIGKMVIRMLKAYDLEVVTFDPFLPDETAAELGVKKVSLEELFKECHVVSNHLANNEQTRGIFTYELFASMRENSTFLNTGRGAQVVEDDLIRALTERPDITAVLDVTMPEPPIDGSPLYTLENCFLTPHIAGSSGNEVHRMAEYMLKEFELYKAGAPCQYEVSLEMLKTMA